MDPEVWVVDAVGCDEDAAELAEDCELDEATGVLELYDSWTLDEVLLVDGVYVDE